MRRQTFTLRRGESRWLRAPAGCCCRTACGSVRLVEPPRWLGEHMVQIDALLRAGQAHDLEAGGWIAVHALTDSVVDLEPPAPVPSRWRIIRTARARCAAA